jgi:mannose-6-phosphate isomerase-like protein (cupin superfamily)
MDIELLAKKYSLEEVDRRLGDTFWSPIDVARINDWVLRVSAVKGEFHWHKHEDDEFFLIYKGEIVIDTENGPIPLKAGEVAVIPKGLKHKPRAAERAVVVLLEPARVNTRGD